MSQNMKKKRGRKPKNNVVVNDNPVFEILNNDLIIKLSNIDSEYNNINNNSEVINTSFVKNTSELCWNCCDKLNNNIVGIPINYIKKKFYIYGDFCSLECCMKFAKDNFKLNKFIEIETYINLYNNIVLKNDDPINMAPNRLLLNIFGGPLTYDEYKKNNVHYNNYVLNIPIGTQVYHTINQNKDSVSNNSKSSLKLYRNKSKSNNDINSILNL